MMNKAALAKRLRDTVAGPAEKKADRIIIESTGKRSGDKTIKSWEVPKQANEAFFAELVDEIETISNEEAAGAGGQKQFRVVALQRGGQALASSTYMHTCALEDDEAQIDVQGVAGGGAGALAGLMIQMAGGVSQRFSNMAISAMQSTFNHLQGMLTKAQERVVFLEGELDQAIQERLKAVGEIEKLMSLRHEREIATITAINTEKRTAKMFEALTVLIPVFANKISGEKIFPENNHQMDMVKKIFGSFTADEIDLFSNLLAQKDPAYKAAFLEIYMTMAKKHHEDDQKDTNKPTPFPQAAE